MKHVILIGGAGYIGSVMTSHFLKKGYRVTVVDNFIYSHQFSVLPYIGDPNYSFIYGDIGKADDLEKIPGDVDDVILLAGLVGDPITKKYPKESKIINDQGIKRCMDYFNGKGIGKFVFISTCSNYGLIDETEVADEDYPLNPLSLYAEDKVDNELYLLSKKGKADYIGVVLRFGTAFGLSPRMRFDLSISDFTRSIFIDEELVVYDPDTWRPYCHIRDFARLLETVMEADDKLVSFEVFNAGGNENSFTKRMIVEEILSILPEGKVSYNDHGSDPRNYRVSFSKVKNQLGFEPDYLIRDGIIELVEAMKMGLFEDSGASPNRYGNYEINY
jgi:nucleoside-diphosphate-sugar epimerase